MKCRAILGNLSAIFLSTFIKIIIFKGKILKIYSN